MILGVFLKHHAHGWTDWYWWTDARVTALGQVVGGIAAVAAFGVALWLLLKQLDQFKAADNDRKRAEERERAASAEGIVAWIGRDVTRVRGKTVTFEVFLKNSGRLPVYTCNVSVELPIQDESRFLMWSVHPLPPGETMSKSMTVNEWDESDDYPFQDFPLPKVGVTFVDNAGVEWSRHWTGLLMTDDRKADGIPHTVISLIDDRVKFVT